MNRPAATAFLLAGVLLLPACRTTPSAQLKPDVPLPAPGGLSASSAVVSAAAAADAPSPASTNGHQLEPASQPARAATAPAPQVYRLSARSLIPLAFHLHPDIVSSFQTFKSEEARYDFFYASNDALTPLLRSANEWSESRISAPDSGQRIGSKEREHVVEVGVQKQFFDTTRMDIATGMRNETTFGEIGNQPYVEANIRYPLWESREKLERTSEDIVRQNDLNDTQLRYIQVVRARLREALARFYVVIDYRHRVEAGRRWRQDLDRLLAQLDLPGHPGRADAARRVQAELVNVKSEVRNLRGLYEIELSRLKSSTGLPYETTVEIDDEPFNPFEGQTHAQLQLLSVRTDPEIATLKNALRNAEAQLDLARRGKWDVALLLNAASDLRGRGTEAGNTEWAVGAGVEISAVDARVTGSLLRQARASISRFKQAIASRERAIYVDTLQPLIRIETLSASRDDLAANLHRYEQDYADGLVEFLADRLTIDNLLQRRRDLYTQEVQIAALSDTIGGNVAQLCSATGKFFELINGEQVGPGG